MTKPGALPLYIQISELLIRDIASGRLNDGERLPPEREMAARLEIAVGTLRQALQVLTEKGLIERIQGSGNYIRAKQDEKAVYAFLRLELLRGGGLPTARILTVDRLRKDSTLPTFGSHDEGHRIRRVRYLSGVPAAVEEIWLCASVKDQLSKQDLSESLYLYYREQLNIWISRAEDKIGLGAVPEWAPMAFPMLPGRPCPLITRVAWSQTGQSVEASFTWYDPATTAYVARLK